MNKDKIILLVGKSGSGKSTIAAELEKKGLKQVYSYTTRPPRYEGEEDEYGATNAQINECDVYVIDPDGVEYFKKAYKGYKKPFVCYLDEPEETLIERMTKRGDDPEKIQSRIAHDREKFSDEIVQRMSPDKVYTSPFPISKDILSCIGMVYVPCGCDTYYAEGDEKKIDDAYYKYQYDWLLRHGYSVEDILALFAKYLVGEIMEDNSEETEQNMLPYIVSMVESFILNCGFNGECYVCKDEFLDYEGRDLN